MENRIINYQKHKKIFYILLCFIISFVFLMIYSDNTSFLAKNWYGSDSSLYMLFGKGLKYGLLPYRDLFDHKGPYFFFLQEIGQFICEGKFGIYILQVLSLFSCLLIGGEIIDKTNSKLCLTKKMLFIFPILWVLAATLEGGNTNEEFSLPFSFFALIEIINYFEKCNKEEYNHSPLLALIYGSFFGLIALSRINNSGFLCSVVFTIVLLLIKNKRYINLVKNAFAFIIGLALVAIPISLFYYANDLLYEMLYSSFIFAFEYATKISFIAKLSAYIFNIDFLFIVPLTIPIYIYYKKGDNNKLLFSLISFITTIIITFIGYGYTHYFILTIPNLMFVIYSLYDNYDFFFLKLNRKILVILMFLLIVLQSTRVIKHLAYSMAHIILL